MVPFVGPSYQLTARTADVQRSINLFPAIIESGTGKAPAYLQSIPGLSPFASLGAAVRGAKEAGGRLFVVAGSTLYEIDSSGAATSRGTLSTSAGRVDMTYGLRFLALADGVSTYALELSSNTFTAVNGASSRIGFLDGFFLRLGDGQRFEWSAIDDATSWDALDFASAEGSPDDLVSLLVDHREVWLFGQKSTEIWLNTGDVDATFQRNSGAVLEVGCIAPFTAQKLDSTVLWLGNDENGDGVVWMAVDGYKPRRVSTHAIEQMLQKSTDMSGAEAFTLQWQGHQFYVLQVPGLETTFCFDTVTGAWHEWAELVDGAFQPHRATCHAYAFGKHLVGADDGNLYWLNKDANTNNGDPLPRCRISPHFEVPSMQWAQFNSFELDCTKGEGKPSGVAASVLLRYSNDGGASWSNWRTASLGVVGARQQRVRFLRLGRSRDRVWEVRCTDDTPFAVVAAQVG